MKAFLFECPYCHRHVRANERACPFCLTALPRSFSRGPLLPPPPAGLSRAAQASPTGRARGSILAGGVAVAAALSSACGGLATFDFADGSVPSSCSGKTYLIVPASECHLSCGSSEPGVPIADYGAPPLEAEAYALCDGHAFDQCTCTNPGSGWTRACPDGKPMVGLSCQPADAGAEASSVTDATAD
jgi:hypothetical protein